jgi:signal transduction histidine kinase
LKNATEHRGIAGKVWVEGLDTELPIDVQHNMLRVCQEAIANAARHGSPATIEIRLGYEQGHLTATIRDDGKGFDPRSAAGGSAGHYGLMVMEERVRRYGGTFQIESDPGKGTTVVAAMPVKRGTPA